MDETLRAGRSSHPNFPNYCLIVPSCWIHTHNDIHLSFPSFLRSQYQYNARGKKHQKKKSFQRQWQRLGYHVHVSASKVAPRCLRPTVCNGEHSPWVANGRDIYYILYIYMYTIFKWMYIEQNQLYKAPLGNVSFLVVLSLKKSTYFKPSIFNHFDEKTWQTNHWNPPEASYGVLSPQCFGLKENN